MKKNPIAPFKRVLTCPNCGGMLSIGANHRGAGLQFECHQCGKIYDYYDKRVTQ